MREIWYILKKPLYIFKGVFSMARKHKLYFLLPICLILAMTAFLVYYLTSTIVVSFIYAGI